MKKFFILSVLLIFGSQYFFAFAQNVFTEGKNIPTTPFPDPSYGHKTAQENLKKKLENNKAPYYSDSEKYQPPQRPYIRGLENYGIKNFTVDELKDMVIYDTEGYLNLQDQVNKADKELSKKFKDLNNKIVAAKKYPRWNKYKITRLQTELQSIMNKWYPILLENEKAGKVEDFLEDRAKQRKTQK